MPVVDVTKNFLRRRSTPVLNGDTVPLLPGMPVAFIGGVAVRASALAQPAAHNTAFVVIGAGPALYAQVFFTNTLLLSTSDWVAVTGEPGGLTPGATYYLTDTPGTMSTSPPTAPGRFLVDIGYAVDDTAFMISPRVPIML